MTVTLENITRAVDGIATIRDVSLTLEGGTEEPTALQEKERPLDQDSLSDDGQRRGADCGFCGNCGASLR
jgi:hypothetical protein